MTKQDYIKKHGEAKYQELLAKNRLRGQANREQRTAYQKAYYQTNKEKVTEQQKAYRESHKEQKSAYNKLYQQSHTEELKAYRKTKVGRANYLLGSYRQKDHFYGRGECTLTSQWIIDHIFSGQVCCYCGESDWLKLGCDRIDNNKPHTPDNVVCSCGKCNNLRQNINQHIFKILMTPQYVVIRY